MCFMCPGQTGSTSIGEPQYSSPTYRHQQSGMTQHAPWPSTAPNNSPPLQQWGPGLTTMTPEIILTVMKHLPNPDAVLLGLTCKTLYNTMTNFTPLAGTVGNSPRMVQRLNLETPKEERLAFLRSLEREIPRLLVCTFCVRLHPRAHDELEVCKRKYDTGCREQQRSVSLGWISAAREFKVRREVLDSVLRCAELGPAFGMSVQELQCQKTWKRTGKLRKAQISVQIEARVAYASGGTPHLLTRAQHSFDVDIEEDVKRQYEDFGPHTCVHDHRGSCKLAMTALSDMKECKSTAESSVVWACKKCPTVVRVKASRVSNRHLFPELTVSIWKDLGSRGSHRNRIWLSQSEDPLRVLQKKYWDRSQHVWENRDLDEVWNDAQNVVSLEPEASRGLENPEHAATTVEACPDDDGVEWAAWSGDRSFDQLRGLGLRDLVISKVCLVPVIPQDPCCVLTLSGVLCHEQLCLRRPDVCLQKASSAWASGKSLLPRRRRVSP